MTRTARERIAAANPIAKVAAAAAGVAVYTAAAYAVGVHHLIADAGARLADVVAYYL